MTDALSFNRRFVRLQAVQRLYAFYIGKRANYDCALDQMREDLIPDVFSTPSVDSVQLAQETQQAVTLFSASLMPSGAASSAPIFSPSSRVGRAVSRALAGYKNELEKDIHHLEGGLKETAVTINQACVRIWQLLVEWTHIATKQEGAEPDRKNIVNSSLYLCHSPTLRRLQADHVLAKRVQSERAGWENYMPQVESWYNQFVKKDLTVQQYLERPVDPVQDQQLLEFLVDNIIFKNGSILCFFFDSDLRWAIHERVVRKVVWEGLWCFVGILGRVLRRDALSLEISGESGQCFYTNLVRKTLQKDEELEALIAKKSENWAVDRIALLDKTIIKLALCEILYFVDIPTKVSINEYVDLSKTYGMPKSSQFVNGLLDAVVTTLHQRGSDTA